MSATVEVIRPHVLGSHAISRFAHAVGQGGEVDTDNLCSRVRDAAWLAIVSVDGMPVGCGALKHPTANHVLEISERSGYNLARFKYELGWVVVDPRARGQKLSRLIVSALLAKAGDSGVFVTVRGDNAAIQDACAGYGFVERGKRWDGVRGELGLGIWERQPTLI